MALFQTKHLWIKQLPDGVALLLLDREHSPTNFIDLAMLDDLDRGLDAVAGESRLLVIRSGKTANFCAGPGPATLAKWSKDDFRVWAERGQAVCAKLSALPMPSVCVIVGGCIDAGLELALACDYRVVVNAATTSLGFHQLEWGMIPCWGGTQRLPHLIGLENSLHMLMAGQRLDARQAWLCNLADHLTEEVDDMPPAFLGEPAKRDWTTFPFRTWRERWLESNPPGRWFLFRGAERIVRTRIPQEMPAPVEMLGALRQAYQAPTIAAGLECEKQALARVVEQPALGNLLKMLTHRETLRLPPLASSDKSPIRQVAVVGSGVCALSLLVHSVTQGHEVVLRAENEEALGAALLRVWQIFQSEVVRGAMTYGQSQKLIAAVRGTHTWTHFDKAHLVLDTTDGPLTDKQAFMEDLEAHVPAAALIVPVTGLHRIDDLRRGLKHPRRVLGLHLIEPWSRGSLAEIATVDHNDAANAQRLRAWAAALGKYCLPIPDRAGGVVMRVWLPALNEAGVLIKEGVPLDRIDQAMRRFGMTYGPCEWMDRLGIDHIAALVASMQSTFAGRINLETGFQLMAESGWRGNQTEIGFYRPGWRKLKPNQEAVKVWQTQSHGESASAPPALSEPDAHLWIQNRLVALMVLEAVRCLEEDLVKDADDLDCAMCLSGWATHRGGPIAYARQLGVEPLQTICDDFAQQLGNRYAPPATWEPLR